MSGAPHRSDFDAEPAASRVHFQQNTRPALAAVDLGADSCRVSLLRWMEDQPEILLVHRFANAPVQEYNTLRWDIRRICDGVQEGLRACAELAPEGIASVGVDGWAVDYVRLNEAGHPIGNPFCYRDQRNIASQKEVHLRISADRLYRLTGIQVLPFNTLYQLHADRSQGIRQSTPWLNLPEFMLHHLGGQRVSEYTNATHTQLLSIENQSWCPEIFQAVGLDLGAAPPVVRPGTDIGRIGGKLATFPAFRNTRLIAPACHDTAAAIAGISAEGDDWAFLSSGTWSLLGCVLEAPCVGNTAAYGNFSNEGGVGGKINFLKIVNGMWLLQQCMAEWQSRGYPATLEDLLTECAVLPPPSIAFDVDDPSLLLPGNMPARINAVLTRAGHPAISEEPAAAPALANLIFHGLAARYASVLRDLASLTGRTLKRLFVVGGGSKNSLLNRLTEKATGLQILAGPVESSTVGNFAIQLAALAGDYNQNIGVTAKAVAGWAGLLADRAVVPVRMQPATINH